MSCFCCSQDCMNTTLEKTQLSFDDGILTIQFNENAVVEVEDVIYIFCYGLEHSKGTPYGVLFDSSSTHEFTEDAITYFAGSSHLHNIIALAYISRDLISKIRLNLLMIFERPVLRPKIFNDEISAAQWLRRQVDTFALKTS
jgi:hypothetical protein